MLSGLSHSSPEEIYKKGRETTKYSLFIRQKMKYNTSVCVNVLVTEEGGAP